MSTFDSATEQNSQTPTVTVIIPCHNHADMVGDAIDSVTVQSYRPMQIVVVDDGSTDNPIGIIHSKKESTDIPITFIKNNTALGPSAARNIAIETMWEKTDLFMMLDADDLYLEGKVSKSVAKFLEYPEHIGIVYTDAVIKNIHTKTKIHEFRQPFDRLALEKECIISNTPLISKGALSIAGGYDNDMRTCEDWDLWLRITENFVAIHIPETLHVYHVTGKNSSDVVPEEVWQKNWAKIRENIQKRKNATSH